MKNQISLNQNLKLNKNYNLICKDKFNLIKRRYKIY